LLDLLLCQSEGRVNGRESTVEQEVVEQIGLYVKVQPFVMTANYPSILAFQPVWRGSATGWAAVDGLHSPSATVLALVVLRMNVQKKIFKEIER
jgi:hypothetical protein